MFIAPLLAALTFAHAAVITVTPDIAEGEVISRTRTIKVRVQSESIVTQVEMYISEELRDSATSTPYTFKIDPLNEKDGDLKLTFTAYTAQGDKASKSVGVKIDTGVSKGAEANTQAAKDLLTQSKWDEAIDSARVALKAKPGYNPARMVLAQAFMHKGIYDKSQQFAEDVVHSEPNNFQALELLSAIQLQRAFNTFSTTTDRTSTIESIGGAIKSAVEARRRILDDQFDKAGAPDPTNLPRYADVAIRTGHFSAAISALNSAFNSDHSTSLGNRIGYAQLRLGRVDDVVRTIALMQKAKTMNAYSYALYAAACEAENDTAKADEAIKEAISQDPEDLGVRTSQVYLALRRGNVQGFTSLANSLGADQGQRTEVNYYLAILNDRLRKYDESDKAFRRAVLAEPLNYEMYIERGNEVLARVVFASPLDQDRLKYALSEAASMYQAALTAKPDSPEALTALTIIAVLQQKPKASVEMADAAAKAGPDYAAAHYAATNVYIAVQSELMVQADKWKKDAGADLDEPTRRRIVQTQGQATAAGDRAKQEFDLASKIDKRRIAGTRYPPILEVFRYFSNYGQLPLLVAPK
jgi:Tfp pilus assembly protein PilF